MALCSSGIFWLSRYFISYTFLLGLHNFLYHPCIENITAFSNNFRIQRNFCGSGMWSISFGIMQIRIMRDIKLWKVLCKHAYNMTRSTSHLCWCSSMSRLHCDLDLLQPQCHTWAICHPLGVTDWRWVPQMTCSNRRVRSRRHHGQHTVLFQFLYPLNLETGWNIEQVQTTKYWRLGGVHYTQLIKQTDWEWQITETSAISCYLQSSCSHMQQTTTNNHSQLTVC